MCLLPSLFSLVWHKLIVAATATLWGSQSWLGSPLGTALWWDRLQPVNPSKARTLMPPTSTGIPPPQGRDAVLLLGVHLHARRVPQHRAAVQHVYRELLRQRVRLVAHHHAHPEVAQFRDRKSTRLNSSHLGIS